MVSKLDGLSDDCADVGSNGIIPSMSICSGVAVTFMAGISRIALLS
jgi:hypothetical protein